MALCRRPGYIKWPKELSLEDDSVQETLVISAEDASSGYRQE